MMKSGYTQILTDDYVIREDMKLGDLKYTVYMHTIKSNGKSYIGYTCKGMYRRLKIHAKMAYTDNSQTFWHRAIRKYGLNDIISKKIGGFDNLKDALSYEVEMIKQYNTMDPATGYNIAPGGTGGKTLSRELHPEKWQAWYDKKLLQVQGVNNGRYSGYTDDQLADAAVEMLVDNPGYTYINGVLAGQKREDIPLSFSKMRFNGDGYSGFRWAVKKKLDEMNIYINNRRLFSNAIHQTYDEIISSTIRLINENKLSWPASLTQWTGARYDNLDTTSLCKIEHNGKRLTYGTLRDEINKRLLEK